MPAVQPAMNIGHLCLVGTGLIGGSLALALRRAGAAARICGVDQDPAVLASALAAGVIDEAHDSLASAVGHADVVVVATPPGAMGDVFAELARVLPPDAVVTDVGSAKGSVIEAARRALGKGIGRFVPGHPIAGTEKSGPQNALAELFQDRMVVLTPLPENGADVLARVRAMWEATGAVVQTLDAGHHDRVLAATSHLPHMLAYALVDCLARMDEKEEIFRYAAGGFADFSRIASSNPVMWRDVCLANRAPLLAMLDGFSAELDVLRGAVERGDGQLLLEIFTRAKVSRDGFVSRHRAGDR